jgi:misacylated tRNA(Ala) deacylase
MTELLYQTDSYLREFDAVVTAVDVENHGVVLDRTAFYPGGGGQPADFGQLRHGDQLLTVKRARRISGKYVHLLDAEDSLPEEGNRVQGILDWDHRFKLMRTHTAMHILCGVIFRDYGASVTGGNMEPLKGRMDFEFETMRAELVGEIETAINVEVQAAREIGVNILPRDEAFQIPDLIRTKINLLPEGIKEVRTVEIKGLDLQADGGTHVQNTSEVGLLKVTNHKNKGRINKRIYVDLID